MNSLIHVEERYEKCSWWNVQIFKKYIIPYFINNATEIHCTKLKFTKLFSKILKNNSIKNIKMLLAQISRTVLTFSIYLCCKGQWYLYQAKKMCLCYFPLPRIPMPNITHPFSVPTRSLNLPKHRFLWKSHQMVGEMEGWIKDFPPASWVFF